MTAPLMALQKFCQIHMPDLIAENRIRSGVDNFFRSAFQQSTSRLVKHTYIVQCSGHLSVYLVNYFNLIFRNSLQWLDDRKRRVGMWTRRSSYLVPPTGSPFPESS